jgi:hypothetical protein
MAKSNYRAWHVDSSEFSDQWSDFEKLRFFARYAILAPSGHNTQPWRFTRDKGTLLLSADYERSLPYSGVRANEPLVSLGACLETLKLAAKGFGYRVNIDYILRRDLTASVQLAGKTSADPLLLQAITGRVSNRSYHNNKNLPDKLLNSLTKTTLSDVSTHVLSKQNDLVFIADQTSKATYRIMGDKKFRVELSKWVRNNLTKQHDGMPGFVQDIPTPPSLLAKHVIKNIDISKSQAKKDSGRILHSDNLIIIVVKNSTDTALLNAGRLYAQICVLAQKNGIATSGLGTAIIDPESNKEIVKQYKLLGKPVAIMRIGKAQKTARQTPRWPLQKINF